MAEPGSGPTPEQVRREIDRRRGRPWPRCRYFQHRRAARRLRAWSDSALEQFLVVRQVRLDPPEWARECWCGVGR